MGGQIDHISTILSTGVLNGPGQNGDNSRIWSRGVLKGPGQIDHIWRILSVGVSIRAWTKYWKYCQFVHPNAGFQPQTICFGRSGHEIQAAPGPGPGPGARGGPGPGRAGISCPDRPK